MKLTKKTTLNPGIITPTYLNDNPLQCGIVHIGLGAFHRAHQAYYLDKHMHLGQGSEWGICASSLRSSNTIDALKTQDNLYTLVEQDNATPHYRVIGSIAETLFAGGEHVNKLIQRLCDANIKIVSMTVTEKGYCYDLNSQSLLWQDASIQHDLNDFNQPQSLIGILARALYQRYQQNLPGLSLLSCDNMPDNGQVLKKALCQFVAEKAPEMLAWVEEQIDFPGTMVDRIVPATTAATLQQVTDEIGVEDACAVSTELFSQWVIEDKFRYGRPALEAVGVEFVADVKPFEDMKLRLLNGSHSLIAYLGGLADKATVAEVCRDENFKKLIKHYMLNEAKPSLTGLPASMDVDAYADALITRFQNTALKHQTQQIAMDGSKKLPQRLLAPALELIQQGRDYPIICLGVAAWMRYVSGVSDAGQPLLVSDPLADVFKKIYTEHKTAEDIVKKFFELGEVFPAALQENMGFYKEVLESYKALQAEGVREILM